MHAHRPVRLVGGRGAERDRVVDDDARGGDLDADALVGDRTHGDVGRHLGPHRRLGDGDEMLLHGLERRHRLAELVPFVGVVDRHLGDRRERAGGHQHARQRPSLAQLHAQPAVAVLDLVERQIGDHVVTCLTGEVGPGVTLTWSGRNEQTRSSVDEHDAIGMAGPADDAVDPDPAVGDVDGRR